MKAIETTHRGCRFRSRVEARWAVFFDTLNIAWEYETQGYVVASEPYLPDFWLPALGVWAEVKGSDQDSFKGRHVDLCRGLADETQHPVLLLVGQPEVRAYNYFVPGQPADSYMAALFADYQPEPFKSGTGGLIIADAYWFQMLKPRHPDGVLLLDPCDDRSVRKSLGQGYLDAVAAARSARFTT